VRRRTGSRYQTHPPQKVGAAWVGTEAVPTGLHLEENEKGSTFLIGFLEPFKHEVIVSKAYIDHEPVKGWDVALLRQFFELSERLQRVSPVARVAIRLTQKRQWPTIQAANSSYLCFFKSAVQLRTTLMTSGVALPVVVWIRNRCPSAVTA
jgi:hypothetical protein